MTNEEAIEQLKNYHYKDGTVPQELLLAIKGLEFINENYPEIFKDYLNSYQIME